MSSNKKRLLRSIFTTNAACGCGKPNPSDIFHPEPKPKPKPSHHHQNPNLSHCSSSCSWDKAGDDNHSLSSITFSLNIEDNTSPPHCSKIASRFKKISDSVAVVKDSDDPYLDFRVSMVQMILEREIYSKDDLQELLNCFLELNSPRHHEIIVRAFTEIWNGLIFTSPHHPSP